MHTFENLKIVLTWMRTDADANNLVITQALQGQSPSELNRLKIRNSMIYALEITTRYHTSEPFNVYCSKPFTLQGKA